MNSVQFSVFSSENRNHVGALVNVWNAACGASLAITPRFVEYNTRPSSGAIQAGRIARHGDQPVGFVLASALPSDPQTSPREMGWIDAIAVAPQFQKQGIGGGLLEWAEAWLREQGCARARLGGSLRPFAPGLPCELNGDAFFRARGFVERAGSARVWDVARDLRGYARANAVSALVRPANAADKDALHEFFAREFPFRWRHEYEEFLRERGRISDYQLLITSRGIDGFARLTFEDSERPIERFYMHTLSRPWGQLGPMGVSEDARGKGYGRALLDSALCRLRDRGVRGCVIDWTDLLDFYSKFGFAPYRKYAMMVKDVR